MDRFTHWLTGLGLLTIGVLALGYSIGQGVARVRQLEVWPKAEAQILKSELIAPEEENTNYTLRVFSRFQAAGKTVEGPSTFVAVFNTRSPEEWRSLHQQFSPGSLHTVRYEPDHPLNYTFMAAYNLEYFSRPLISLLAAIIAIALGASVLGRRRIRSFARPARS